ncbi:hypothetical protein [Shewanella scandinavica]|uniref:Uncharacterized protein n=1 Tax=Shewanella scandinavica TaxID=3063538 RepID=A0ABU3FYD5_9GAMM|nr:hypothetical protein [Shewanella sp. SP2S1-2]MDT3280385.1 hypothetical protein [Shewanella sp. SP2S1-2]
MDEVKRNIIINSLEKRVSWGIFRVLGTNAKLDFARGLAATANKWREYEMNDIVRDSFLKLDEFYKNHFLYFNKTVSVDEVDHKAFLFIYKNATMVKPSIDAVAINYPYIDENTDLLLSELPCLTHVSEDADGINFVYASVKSMVETFPISVSSLKDTDVFDSLDGVFDIRAKRRITRRYYDSVYLRKSDSTIELKLDTAAYLSKDDTDNSFNLLRDVFYKDLRTVVELDAKNFARLNFFTLIPAIYHNHQDRACELGFCVGDVIHHERLRLGHHDLRQQLFHKAGVEKVSDIQLFRIAVKKVNKIGSEQYNSELYFPGVSRMTGDASPYLSYVVLSDCCSKNDYDYFIQSIKDCKSSYFGSHV